MEETRTDKAMDKPMEDDYKRGAEAGPQRTLTPKTRKNLMIWAILLVIVFGVAAIIQFGAQKIGAYFTEAPEIPDGTAYIAVMYIEGVIMDGQADAFGIPFGYQHRWTLDEIDRLMDDEMNKGLLIFVDSPGGGVYESDELYLKLLEYKEQTGRPVYSSMGSMAASGGYYISAAADKIIANRNTWTGSIGVTIGTFYDISQFLANNGIETTTITSGANKAMGTMTEPLTAEQQAIFQALVDECYEQFTGIVAEGRGLDPAEVKKLADGRIYTAKQAIGLGLVDEIGTMEDAVTDMRETYALQDCEVYDIVYMDDSFWSMLMNAFTQKRPTGDAAALLELVGKTGAHPIRYMFAWQ